MNCRLIIIKGKFVGSVQNDFLNIKYIKSNYYFFRLIFFYINDFIKLKKVTINRSLKIIGK
jgi:hypothetical protein